MTEDYDNFQYKRSCTTEGIIQVSGSLASQVFFCVYRVFEGRKNSRAGKCIYSRLFAAHKESVKHLSSQECLKALGMYSLKQREMINNIVYAWKVIENPVPSLHTTIAV